MGARACFSFLFLFLTYSLNAYNLRQLSSKEGLSNSAILSICQDSDRFMWFGSADGLNMYDGVNITIFKPSIDARGSLSGNLIQEVLEAEKDIIWINTNYGLNRFNKKTREIESYNASGGKHYLAKTSNNKVFTIHENHKINYYDKNKKQFIPISYPDIQRDDIQRIFIDKTNVLWIVTNKGVVYNARIFFDPGIPVIQKLDDFAHDCEIRDAFMENDQIYFIDQNDYLFEMDAVSRKKSLIIDLKNELNERGQVSSIIKDNEDYLIAFQTNGLIRVQNTSERLIKYEIKEIGIYCGVFSIYKDEEQDIIWIGTDGQGVYMYTRDLFSIRSIAFDQLQFTIQKPVRAFFLDKDRTLWAGTKGDGIFLIENYNPEVDIRRKEMRHVTTSNSALFNNSVYAFGKSRRNLFWIGGDGPGLNYYSYKERKIKRVASFDDTEPIQYIHSIREVNDSTLWLASVGAGIYKVIVSGSNDDPIIKSVRRFTYQKDEMSYNYFFTTYQENDSIMWFGNRGYGLMRLNINNENDYPQLFLKNLAGKSYK